MKISIPQIENLRESFTSKKSGAEDIISGFKDKLKDLDEIRKGRKEERKNIGKEYEGKMGYHQKTKPSNYRHRGGRRIPGQWS